jgi:outer membrane protein OmpA-like peptidoglycan-associated protein
MQKLVLTGAAFGALLGAAAAVTPALAGDAPAGALVPGMQVAQVPPPPPPMLSWTGFYVGANGGWVSSARDKIVNTGTDTGTAGLGSFLAAPGPFGPFGGHQIPAQFSMPYDGWQAGGTIGYNLQVAPQWVLGFEMDFDDGDATDKRAFAFSGIAPVLGNNLAPGGNPGVPPFATAYKRSIGFISTDRVRAGFLPTPTLMVFGSAGLSWGETEMQSAFFCPTCAAPAANSATANTHHRWGAGLAWGGGAEWMFLPNWSLKAEYIRADLGTNDANIRYNYGANTSSMRSASTFVEDIVRVGVNYHFAPPPPPPAPAAMPAPPPAAPKVFIVFFDWDRDSITNEGRQIIAQAADAYKSGAPVQIQVTGYTDRSGSAGYNQRLSERRANNVAKALAALGVPPAQMVVSGRGENDNRVPTANGVREPQNRRVEIVTP